MINIGIIGDYSPDKVSHPATNSSIRHAAAYSGIETTFLSQIYLVVMLSPLQADEAYRLGEETE